MKKKVFWAALLTFMGIWTGVYLSTSDRIQSQKKPTFDYYAGATATFPQMAFWSAHRKGLFKNDFEVEPHIWKNLDDLRGILLAGKGDLWLGSLEVFAQAKSRGAPVSVLAVSAWRKFYLITREPDVTGFDALAGKKVVYTPMGAPSAAILTSLMGRGLPAFQLSGMEPKALALSIMDHRIDTCVAPEPLVSDLLSRIPDLRAAACLEETYGRLTGHPPRTPVAGLAVNTEHAKKNPEMIRRLITVLKEESALISKDPERYFTILPSVFYKFISPEQLSASLERDVILTLPAYEVEGEIKDYLKIIQPGLFSSTGWNLPEDFIWR